MTLNSQNILYVYNSGDDDSLRVAQEYALIRQIPGVNLFGIDTSTVSVLDDRDEFVAQLESPIRDKIEDLGGFGTTIQACILGYRIPAGYNSDTGVVSSCSAIASMYIGSNIPFYNPAYRKNTEAATVHSFNVLPTCQHDMPTYQAMKKKLSEFSSFRNGINSDGSLYFDRWSLEEDYEFDRYAAELDDFEVKFLSNYFTKYFITSSPIEGVRSDFGFANNDSFFWSAGLNNLTQSYFRNTKKANRIFFFNADTDSLSSFRSDNQFGPSMAALYSGYVSTAGMMSSFTVTTDVETSMPGLYGSNKAAQFVSDALSQKSSLDFIHIGDSNTGFADSGDSINGYCDGFAAGMEAISPNTMYGTPLYGMGHIDSPNYGYLCNPGSLNSLAGNNDLSPPISISASDEFPISDQMDYFIGAARVNSASTASSMWRYDNDSDRWAAYILGIYLDPECPIIVTSSLTYRVVHGTFASGAGEMRVLLRLNETPNSEYGVKTISFNGVDGDIAHSHITWDSNETRLGKNIQMATAGGGVGVQNGISANFNLAWNSVITSKIGYASSVLSHVGGARLKGITDTIADSTDRFIETYCKEISLRQKQASGLTYARAIFVFNAGQNGGDDDSDNDWTLYTQEACQKIKNAWIAVGESNDNLAFIFLTSHQVSSDDSGRDGLRLQAKEASEIWTDFNITAVNITELVTWNEMTADNNLLFNNSTEGDPHLSNDGYTFLSSKIIAALKNGVRGDTVPQDTSDNVECWLRPEPFFSSLSQNLTILEAMYFSSPMLNCPMTYFADPLMKVDFRDALSVPKKIDEKEGWGELHLKLSDIGALVSKRSRAAAALVSRAGTHRGLEDKLWALDNYPLAMTGNSSLALKSISQPCVSGWKKYIEVAYFDKLDTAAPSFLRHINDINFRLTNAFISLNINSAQINREIFSENIESKGFFYVDTYIPDVNIGTGYFNVQAEVFEDKDDVNPIITSISYTDINNWSAEDFDKSMKPFPIYGMFSSLKDKKIRFINRSIIKNKIIGNTIWVKFTYMLDSGPSITSPLLEALILS